MNFADKDGLSPLMGACVFGNVEIAHCLVELGATIEQKDDEGQLPYLSAN